MQWQRPVECSAQMSRSLATIVMIAAAGLASTACTRFKNTQGYIVDAALVDGITTTRAAFRDDINTAQRVIGFTGTGIMVLAVFAALAILLAAERRIPILAYHFAWPGIGHVAKAGDGFRYVPEAMRMVL